MQAGGHLDATGDPSRFVLEFPQLTQAPTLSDPVLKLACGFGSSPREAISEALDAHLANALLSFRPWYLILVFRRAGIWMQLVTPAASSSSPSADPGTNLVRPCLETGVWVWEASERPRDLRSSWLPLGKRPPHFPTCSSPSADPETNLVRPCLETCVRVWEASERRRDLGSSSLPPGGCWFSDTENYNV